MTIRIKITPNHLTLGLVTALLVLLLSLGVALAAGEQLGRTLTGSGGGQVGQNGLSLHSAIGQPAAGLVENELTLCSGFLCGPRGPLIVDGDDYDLYLPLILR